MAGDFYFDKDRYLLVGEVRKPHGLRGEVKILAYSDDAETLLHYDKIVLVDTGKKVSPVLTVEKARLQGKVAVLKLYSINDRDSAAALYGKGVLVDKTDLPLLEEDEYYWYRLYNLPVSTEEGEKLGIIASIFSNGAQDIMVVKNGEREILIPIIDGIIKEETEQGIIITPLPGLLEINS